MNARPFFLQNTTWMAWTVAVVAAVALVPWLGLAEYSSKGEPREAVVAVSMLKDGNWILPVNNGGDIPYKPPMLHWIIALLSMLTGGRVSEFLSRLPSALSLVIMAAGLFRFYACRWSRHKALTGVLLLLTAFEVHRAATVCRVDMLLTAFTVWAICELYAWHEHGWRGWSWGAVAAMSGATLTKGPIGVALPLLVTGAWWLATGRHRLWAACWRLVCCTLLACLLPAVWYIAAWQQGDDAFLALVYEENIGRLTGSMGYDSHQHPAVYNVVTMLAGWAPWTLLALAALAGCIRRKGFKWSRWPRWQQAMQWIQAHPLQAFTWMAPLLIFGFYCLPSSKRSVYLLPCYPFMAMLLADMSWRLLQTRRGLIKGMAGLLACIGLLLTSLLIAIRTGAVPDTLFHGKHAAENVAMLHALAENELGVAGWLCTLLPTAAAMATVWLLTTRSGKMAQGTLLGAMLGMAMLVYVQLDGMILPTILNTKSTRPVAEMLAARFPGEPLYQHISSPMLHFFGIDYYTGDGLAQFEREQPEKGILLIPGKDYEEFKKAHPDYRFQLEWKSEGRITEAKDTLMVFRVLKE